MEMKYVQIIYNDKEFTPEKIKNELVDEKYGDDYRFQISNEMSLIDVATEVWTFGNVAQKEVYKKAVDLGKDIWIMG